jgi:hypothetical protein
VVRGPAAVLAPLALLAGVAYFLLAAELPDASHAVAAMAGALAVALCALSPLAGRDEAVGVAVFGLGAALLAVALNAEDVGAAATPVEALFAAAAGLLFGLGFGVPAVVVALPVLVAGIDAASLVSGGSEALVRAGDDPDVLTLDLPLWGGGGDVARLGLLDAVFLALFAAWSLRFRLRPRIALPLMAAGLVASAGLGVALDEALPALPFLALGFLLPAASRIPRLLRGEEE